MASPRPTILLTGFDAFPGVPRNATAELVPEIAAAARRQLPDYDVVDAILPVDWTRAPVALQELLARTAPRLALHFGVSPSATGIQLELTGRNICSPRHDAAGNLPVLEAVIPAGPESLAATLPAAAIIARLAAAGIPSCTSDDAGGYLCNALLYHSLSAARALPTPHLAGFIHLPSVLSSEMCAADDAGAACRLGWAAAIAGSLEIIAACLDNEPA